MKKWVFRGATSLALLTSLGITGCSHDEPPRHEVMETGRLSMNLETVSDSGKIYRLRQAAFPVQSFDGRTSATLNSEDDPSSAVLETFLPPGDFFVRLQPGWFMEQEDRLLHTVGIVDAKVRNDFQFFTIESNKETPVSFDFDVNGERVTFQPGRLIVKIGVQEREGGAGGIDPRKSLLETRQDAIGQFSLEQVLTAAQVNSGLSPDPVLTYHEIIDSYASAANGRLPSAVHCGDETTDGVPSLNGYPIRCDRAERFQFDNIGKWFPTAAVNRIDLAPLDGAHCGQQRLIFANNANGRVFMIFEAQIPNPNPSCGLAACKPLADFWAAQSTITDPKTRNQRLLGAYLNGDPDLLAAGFRPFISVDNLSVGTGSIRTNNFDDGQWTLRQFKLMSDPLGQTRTVPFPVSESPHGELWNDTSKLPAGAGCRENFLSALSGLLSDNPQEMAFIVDTACRDSESQNDFFTEDYRTHLANGSGDFRAALAARLAGTGLTPENIADRARFAGSCIGCHEEANGVSLGRGVIAPFSNGFVHVDESGLENCGDGSFNCFTASPALKNVFLPRRLQALNDVMALGTCTPGGFDGGVPSLPPPAADGGAPVPPPPAADGGVVVVPADAGARPPSSVLTPDETIQDLVKEEQTAREPLKGETTVGGQPAQVSH